MESGFRHLNIALLAVSAATLAAGLLARYLNADALARDLWLVGVVPNWLALAVTIKGTNPGGCSGGSRGADMMILHTRINGVQPQPSNPETPGAEEARGQSAIRE
ncbi:hypothetical protein [Ralstonia mannitolilytica]|uniref:hypothetical protein n=1 Tax=Ralstonia mannitolilytica TaxID=105219 RepID=UPI00292DF55F|nr:hypothetical protein [Ralstonia mannitolilytica]